MTMKFSIDQLRVFATAAKSDSFGAAALDLGISQPAVRKSISQLETALGVELFNRTRDKITLTGNGIALLSDTLNVLEKVEHFNAKLDFIKKAHS
ncbi:LysR family transcriptional regulator [Pseudomonas sp. Z1-14]|uniref:LysR family transcriptional regulator n=1 Tax=Pseudomonas sp. Z1-14 TaxID=2817409 RepID=UPI003DA9D50A